MRELWSNNPVEILKELEMLIEEEIPFSLFEREQPARKVFMRRIAQEKEKCILTLVKTTRFRINNPQFAFIFYQKGPCPMRGFQIQLSREDDQFLHVCFPSEIFQVQRRKFPRFTTPHDSNASLIFKNRTRLYRAKVIDVSLEGTLIRGIFLSNVKTGDLISPLTLVLYALDHRLECFKVQVPEAKLTRLIDLGNDIRELGIHFTLKGDNLKTLQEYIDTRTMESAINSKNNEQNDTH